MKNVATDQQLEEYAGILRHLATRFTQDYDEIQDLVQETFVRALKYTDNFIENPKIVSWLFVIMRNVYINQYRNYQYRRNYEQHSANQYLQMSYSEPYVDDNMEKRFVLQDVQRHLNTMPENYKEIFTSYINGYKYRELADIYDIPEGTIKSRIHFIRKSIQRKMGA